MRVHLASWMRVAAVGLFAAAEICCGGASRSSTVTTTPPTAHRVDLSWNRSPSSIAGYNIYRASTAGGPYSRLNPQAQVATVFTDTLVQAGSTYYYAVTAVDASSNESSFSNEVAATVPSP